MPDRSIGRRSREFDAKAQESLYLADSNIINNTETGGQV